MSRLVVEAQTPSPRSDDMTRLLHVAGLATTLISHSPTAADARYTCGAGFVRAVERTLDPLHLAAGDRIGICVNAVQMVVESPGGTGYRAPLTALPATCPAPKRDACDLVP